MNNDDIIRMAREAGFSGYMFGYWDDYEVVVSADTIERFAALVAAAERERLKWDGIHSCHPECDRPACVNMRTAVEAEREACLEWCAAYASDDGTAQKIIAAIRARGQR